MRNERLRDSQGAKGVDRDGASQNFGRNGQDILVAIGNDSGVVDEHVQRRDFFGCALYAGGVADIEFEKGSVFELCNSRGTLLFAAGRENDFPAAV